MNNKELGYELLQKQLYSLTGIDLAAYKQRQMRRRLAAYLDRTGSMNYRELAQRIAADAEALEHLKAYLTINVSEFFRDQHPFELLASTVLPELRRQFGSLKIWSAGCSFGYEPYSVGILLEEQDPGGGHTILGSDLDETALAVARQGLYDADKLKGVSDHRRQQFFQAEGDDWRVKERVRRMTRFKKHDLLQDPYPRGKHLILCRNVVIYFTDAAKAAVHRQLAEALVPGGYLLVGATETIFSPRGYGLESVGPFLYRRLPAAVSSGNRQSGSPIPL